jgi:urease accessory protein
MSAAAGSWHARLELEFQAAGERTILARRKHVGPLVVQRPFYPEGGICHVYLVHPPGGIVGGDALELQVQAQPGSHALITTPAATRFYRAGPHPRASLNQQLHVHDATLEWLPQETIVFDGARAHSRTSVHLHGDARFLGWEVLCLGRPANDEPFAQGELHQDFSLYHDGVPLLLDRLRLRGDSAALPARWGFDAAQAMGTLLMYPAHGLDLDALRSIGHPDARAALTLVDGVLLCRVVAMQGEAVRQLLGSLWLQLRPGLLGRTAVAPRIWAT